MVKYGPQIVEDICKLVRVGNSHKDAAALCDIGEDTFYDWRKKHPQFAESLKKAELQCKQRSITIVQRAMTGRDADPKKNLAAINPNWNAAAWWLERRYASEYAERREISGPGGVPITTRELSVPNLAPGLMKKLAMMSVPEANGSGDGHDGDALAGAGA
jgi:hypothetical protein